MKGDSPIPPLRDLPPGRLAQRREHLLFEITRERESRRALARLWPSRSARPGRRHLVALAAAVLVVVVVTASAFGTVRDLFGDGKPHVQRGFYPGEGKRGSFTVRILFMRDAGGDRTRSWRIVPELGVSTGQYAQVTGRGRIVRIGGRAQAWNARLEGFVTRPGEAKQRIVITMKGRPEGVFVLTPLQPGVLKRDSGTLRHTATTG